MIFQRDSIVDGMFLTQIKLYFKNTSPTFGMGVEIRTMENGFPTAGVVPGGKSYLTTAEISKSDDGSVATSFFFDSLPILKTNTMYAMVLIPDGGNDEYDVWIAKDGSNDISTGSQIFRNNQIGNLFIASNDDVPTAVLTESIKYDLYTAVFTSTGGISYLRPQETEFICVNDQAGTFVIGEPMWMANSVATGYAQTTTNSTYVTVPDSSISDLGVNNWIYVAKSDRSAINFRRVVNNTVNSTTIIVGANTTFTNTTCIFGRVHGDTALYASLKSLSQVDPEDELELRLVDTTANDSINFNDAAGKYIFGLTSNASAIVTHVVNKSYHAIVPHVNYVAPAQTNVNISYSGYSNSGSISGRDTSYIRAVQDVPNEFSDKERMLYSRSNALQTSGIGSNASLLIKVDLNTSNNLTAPYIDRLGTMATLTYNAIASEQQLSGYYLNISNVSGSLFAKGQKITQNTTSGVVNATIDFANSSFLRVNLPTGTLVNAAINCVATGTTANVSTAVYFDETLDSGYYNASRYISKNVVLADKQDAEDLINFVNVYRPVGTQFKVYAKFLNGSDPDNFNAKHWSYMSEFDATTALFSSPVNRNDVVEAQYGLPKSAQVQEQDARTNVSLANITVSDTNSYTANSFIYLYDNTTEKFIVRKIRSIANSTTMTLESKPSFTSTNTAVGIIPGLASECGAFLYDRNNFIIRYATSTDLIYDTYKTFAVKIVPISNSGILIPIMKNVRSLALQI